MQHIRKDTIRTNLFFRTMNVLEKALMMTYVNSRMTVKNLEVVLHEMSIMEDKDLGKLQFYTERLIKANKDMYSMLERNLGKATVLEIEKDVELLLEQSWE